MFRNNTTKNSAANNSTDAFGYWDIEKYKDEHECEEHWQLRKAFMEKWKKNFPEDRLICLPRVYTNIEFMGCRYPAPVMQQIAQLSFDFEVGQKYKDKKKTKLQRTFVAASTAAEDRARGIKRVGGEMVTNVKPKSTRIAFVAPEIPALVEDKNASDEECMILLKGEAASSDVPNPATNQPTKAASLDAPNTTKFRGASIQDAPKRKPPKVASSDAPRHNKQKQPATSKDAMRKATARYAPNQAASKATPTPSASGDARTDPTLSARPRAAVAHSDSTVSDGVDAPTRAASASLASERDLTSLTEAIPARAANTTGIDMSSLRDVIQSPVKQTWTTVSRKATSSKRRLSAPGKSAQQCTVAATAGVSVSTLTPAGAATSTAKSKRSLRRRGRKKLKTTGGEPSARAQKRERPEDSVTPTGIGKKSRPARSHMVDGSLVSYAEAAASYRSNELCVAVMSEPFEDMTQVQAEEIRLNIEKEMRAQLMADPDPSNPTVNTAIHFRGKAHFAEGVLKTWCEDAFTLAWLKRIVINMTSPVPRTSLTVRPQAEIPNKALCMLFVPENTEDTPALLKLLTRQNPNLKISTWTLTHERVRQEPPGTCLFFRVPESMVKTIKDQNRRVYYLMGSIYIRFLEEGVTGEGVTAPSTTTAPVVPGPEHDPPRRSSSPPALETVGEVRERTSSPAIEVDSINKGPTQDPSSPGLISDEDCFLAGEERYDYDSSLCSSTLRDN